MKTKIIIPIVLFLALLGGGAYFVFNNSSARPDKMSDKTTSDKKMVGDKAMDDADSKMMGDDSMTEEDLFSGDLSALFKLGKDYQCTTHYEDPDTGNTSDGVVYMASMGNKMSATITTEVDGATETSNIISDGEYSYVWSSSLPQGFKTKLDPEDPDMMKYIESAKEASAEKDGAAVMPDENLDFKCKKWSVDESKFTPPTDVEFMDTSALMNMENLQSMTGEDLCAACDSAPEGAARDQCKQALGC